jgi:16S rRNA (adenine1518-N6/adenine1519-N6)-dimethyltransferase
VLLLTRNPNKDFYPQGASRPGDRPSYPARIAVRAATGNRRTSLAIPRRDLFRTGTASPRDLCSTSHQPRVTSHVPCYTVTPMARQRLGQHFLADLHWREEIARAIRVSPHSTVPLPRDDQHCWIEIGSGHGEMTQHLLAASAPVHAIEIDPKFYPGLRHLAKQFPNLTVVPGDILKADLPAIASGRRIRIYGNLPYYITSPILHHLFTFADFIDEIHVVIQTEVALRLAAQPGTRDYGYLSVVTQFYTRPEFVFEIPRDAFEPPPEVASALVTLRLPGERAKLSLSDASRFLDFVKLCFSQKRKTLVNNLRSLAKPDQVREALATLKLRPDSRAEQLPVAQLAALHAQLAGS